jgi:ubiquitin carboxyl-terminal hydrolase L5
MSGGWNTSMFFTLLLLPLETRVQGRIQGALTHDCFQVESDAGVFTYLLENLGVKDIQFEELLSLDPLTLQSLHPVYGLIFLFKFPTDKPYSGDSAPLDGTYDREAAETIFFAQQTIQNACGTQALLSVVLNRPEMDIGEQLRDFRDFTAMLPPDIRGEALSNSELIRGVHNSFAKSSPFVDETTQPRGSEAEDVFHFVAYLPINGRLYELDGLHPAPISHGAVTDDTFPDKVLQVLQRRIARYETSEIRFNLLAMVRDRRIAAREIGDEATLDAEERKREAWMFENALRRHNFVAFAGEILKGVVRSKLRDGKYDQWVQQATDRKAKELEAAKKMRALRAAGAMDEDQDMVD